jgi:hypothetical protein
MRCALPGVEFTLRHQRRWPARHAHPLAECLRTRFPWTACYSTEQWGWPMSEGLEEMIRVLSRG